MLRALVIVCAALPFGARISAAADSGFAFQRESTRLTVSLDGQPIATYVWGDPRISRPYFCDLHTPAGTRVTRNHPPIEGQDLTDHDTFHPGLWLAFGDLSGSDFWRLKSPVVHAGFVEEPKADADQASFVVRNRYLSAPGGGLICGETARYRFSRRPGGYWLECVSEFANGGRDFTFGDQEEMGLGVRLATPLIVKRGGTIVNSAGQRDEAEAWGQPAQWCDYSGIVEGSRVGVTTMPSPRNFRESWFHVRDYGLMAANPFGRKALTGGEASRVSVRPGETFRLAYCLWVHEGPADGVPRPADEFAAYSAQEQVSAK